jgi:hypothetical protein
VRRAGAPAETGHAGVAISLEKTRLLRSTRNDHNHFLDRNLGGKYFLTEKVIRVILKKGHSAGFLFEDGELHEKAAGKDFKKASKEEFQKSASETLEKAFKKIFKETCHKRFYENIKKTSLDPLRRSGQECQYDAIYRIR